MKKLLLSGLLSGLLAASISAKETNDPYIWLEEVQGKEALEWVEENNKVSLDYLQSKPLYNELYEANLEILNSDDRIPYVNEMNGYLYNFWRDEKHVRGIWRRTTLKGYKKNEPKWEVILDIDALAKKEDENWVYKGANCLYPDYQRCLISLSRGGADATVVREFNVESKSFVKDGFQLPEAKSDLSWIDENSVFVGTDFGPNSLTNAGYPRITKLWKRGQKLEDAMVVFEGEQTDVSIQAHVTRDKEKSYNLVYQIIDIYSIELYLFTEDGLTKLERPTDSPFIGINNGQLLIDLKSDWTIGDKTYHQASIISIDINDYLAGKKNFTEVLVPDDRTAISEVSSTKDYLLVNLLKDVSNELHRYWYADGKWQSKKFDLPELGALTVSATSDKHNNFFVTYTSFLTPSTLSYFDEKTERFTELKNLSAFFDTAPYKVEQHFAKADDGVKVPYFVVMRKDTKYNGKNPTLLVGYGGFEISLRPNYLSIIGKDWLEQGGVFVLANIRGGGEYGPAWHQAALKQNRHVAFNDFIRIAEDLIENKITSADHLGIHGGSNGGLLVGAVATMRPDLFDAVVCQVPLLDMKRYNKLLAGASWMGEYGNPDNEDEWNYIKTYSPYHNVHEDAEYPKIFFSTSTRDDRVHPGHARKMVAKMQEMDHDVLYYENTEGGHGAAANNEQSAKLNALIYTYLADQLK